MAKVVSVGCVGFLVEGTGTCVLVVEAGSCLSGGRTTSGGGCVLVLLIVWHRVSITLPYWSLSRARS